MKLNKDKTCMIIYRFVFFFAAQTQCEQCGKMVLASRLHIHRKIHSGVKSHLCDLCGRAFLLKAYLNAHIRVNHRGLERPKRFMCSSCGYTCDQRHKLEVHERIHTDERVKQRQKNHYFRLLTIIF